MGAALTRLLAWNYGEHFEWQRVAAGSNLFSAVPCGQERLQLDGQHDRQPGGSQVSRLWSAVHVPPQQLPATLERPPDTRARGEIESARRTLALRHSRP